MYPEVCNYVGSSALDHRGGTLAALPPPPSTAFVD
jgi:hypothetical protein